MDHGRTGRYWWTLKLCCNHHADFNADQHLTLPHPTHANAGRHPPRRGLTSPRVIGGYASADTTEERVAIRQPPVVATTY